MLNLLGALCFAGFLGGLALVHLTARARPQLQRTAVRAFLLYCLAATFGAGLTQHDLWPFARWPMAAGSGERTG